MVLFFFAKIPDFILAEAAVVLTILLKMIR
jgi:hypothetical protein